MGTGWKPSLAIGKAAVNFSERLTLTGEIRSQKEWQQSYHPGTIPMYTVKCYRQQVTRETLLTKSRRISVSVVAISPQGTMICCRLPVSRNWKISRTTSEDPWITKRTKSCVSSTEDREPTGRQRCSNIPIKNRSWEKVEPGLGEPQWQIHLKEDGSLFNNVPFSTFLPSLRFPCEQSGRDATSYEYRPIDDCSASGLNLATSTCEKMHVHWLGTLLASAHAVREVVSEWGDDGLPIFAKGDHEKAYRQCPVHEDDYSLVVTLVWNDIIGPHCGFEVYAHRALPFGALSSVIIYTTISQGMCLILRRLFSVAQHAYVDDFLRCSPKRWAVI